MTRAFMASDAHEKNPAGSTRGVEYCINQEERIDTEEESPPYCDLGIVRH